MSYLVPVRLVLAHFVSRCLRWRWIRPRILPEELSVPIGLPTRGHRPPAGAGLVAALVSIRIGRWLATRHTVFCSLAGLVWEGRGGEAENGFSTQVGGMPDGTRGTVPRLAVAGGTGPRAGTGWAPLQLCGRRL